MSKLKTLLDSMDTSSEFMVRRMSLIFEALETDKRFLPLVASDIYVQAVELFWESTPDPSMMQLLSRKEIKEAVDSSYAAANNLVKLIRAFIESNSISLEEAQ